MGSAAMTSQVRVLTEMQDVEESRRTAAAEFQRLFSRWAGYELATQVVNKWWPVR